MMRNFVTPTHISPTLAGDTFFEKPSQAVTRCHPKGKKVTEFKVSVTASVTAFRLFLSGCDGVTVTLLELLEIEKVSKKRSKRGKYKYIEKIGAKSRHAVTKNSIHIATPPRKGASVDWNRVSKETLLKELRGQGKRPKTSRGVVRENGGVWFFDERGVGHFLGVDNAR